MKKIIIFILFIIMISCKSVENWNESPVLSISTSTKAEEYVVQQQDYLNLIKLKSTTDVNDGLTIEELNIRLIYDKKIALSSQRVLNSWFDFYIILRQDPGFNRAYKGHFYFRKAIEALGYSDKMNRSEANNTLKESKNFEKIKIIEGKCRLAIGEIVAYNSTLIETDKLYKELKVLYKSMN